MQGEWGPGEEPGRAAVPGRAGLLLGPGGGPGGPCLGLRLRMRLVPARTRVV